MSLSVERGALVAHRAWRLLGQRRSLSRFRIEERAFARSETRGGGDGMTEQPTSVCVSY